MRVFARKRPDLRKILIPITTGAAAADFGKRYHEEVLLLLILLMALSYLLGEVAQALLEPVDPVVAAVKSLIVHLAHLVWPA